MRPEQNGKLKRSVYSGQKSKHCLGYYTITMLDGLIFLLYGLEEGCHHEIILLRHSEIETVMEERMVIDSVKFYLYGDTAYIIRCELHFCVSQKPWSRMCSERQSVR